MLNTPLRYILDIPSLQPGDVILTAEGTGRSKLVRKATDGDFSHVMLHVGGGSCIHSDGDGVHAVNVQRLIFDDAALALVFRLRDRSPQVLDRASVFARAEVGKQYSVPEAARSRLRRKTSTAKTANRQFCSRLVAQAYACAGVNLVANPDYCYPQDIADSPLLLIVDGCVRMATDAEVELAHTESPLETQKRATNEILSFARSLFGTDVQTLEDLGPALAAQPHHDALLTAAVKCSGYLDLWTHEVEQNAWRYDGKKFMQLPIADSAKVSRAKEELQSATEQLDRYAEISDGYSALHAQSRLTYHAQQAELYRNLVHIMQLRSVAAEFVLSQLAACDQR